MAVIAEFTLPPDGFALGPIFEVYPEATLELDRIVPTGETVMPYFWVSGEDIDMEAVKRHFESLPEVQSIRIIDNLQSRGLFCAKWEPDSLGIMGAVGGLDIAVLAASGTQDGWSFEMRAPTSTPIQDFQEYCQTHEIPVALARFETTGRKRGDAEERLLTTKQREALISAFEYGYYDSPRGTSLEDLANALGISRSAITDRLRRGHRNLVEDHLFTQESD